MTTTNNNVSNSEVNTKKMSRRRRTAAQGLRGILTLSHQDPNYVYRWVADDPNRPDRIQKLQELGYEIVVDDTIEVGDKAVDRPTKLGSAITRHGGGGVTLVLMRQRREWWEEDQKFKQEKVDTVERMMQRDVERGMIPGTQEPAARGSRLSITRS